MGGSSGPAFSGCTALTTLNIGNNVTIIFANAFSDCPISDVTMPFIYSDFINSSLEKLTITSACTAGCLESATNLQELSVPFIGTSPTDPTTLVTLFNGSVPASLKKLSTVYSSAKITIASGALSGLSQLSELTLSSNVIGVGNDALSGCSGIRDIYVHSAAAPAAYEGISEDVHAQCVLHVPTNCAGHYGSSLGWKEFFDSGRIQEEAPLIITAYAIPRRGGEIYKSAEQFNYGTICTLWAHDNWDYYYFQCWMEDNTVVSIDNEYTFTVTASRTLYAVFAPRENADENIQIQVQPQSATVSWTAATDATSYKLVIYRDGSRTDTVAAFQLDANGQVQQSSGVRAAQQDLSCSIPNLIAETQYYYSLTSYDAEDYALTIAVGDFTTQSGLGIESVEDSEIKLYPNPVKESFRIAGLTAPTQVTVANVSGRTVWQQTVAGDESISVGHLPQGIYLVRVNGRTVKTIKN
jgi:hypothetical protein